MFTDSERLLAEAAGLIARRDAEILLAHALNISRSQLIVRDGPVPADVIARFTDACARRARGYPVAYLLGRREFWSLDLEVNAAVLVPRPETELLVQRVLDLVANGAARIADLGTGSGAIAIALAHERSQWSVTATDSSADALAVARGNGERLAPGRIEWLMGDWFAPLSGRRFDAIVSNPPYIAGNDPVLGGDGLEFEPRGALTPGGDGTAALATLINGAPDHLDPGGWLLLEHGNSQGEWARSALVARGFTHVTSAPDLAGHERVTSGQWSN
jgi:release factor glutamine methyltransferase